jgi:hypothetical protein
MTDFHGTWYRLHTISGNTTFGLLRFPSKKILIYGGNANIELGADMAIINMGFFCLLYTVVRISHYTVSRAKMVAVS